MTQLPLTSIEYRVEAGGGAVCAHMCCHKLASAKGKAHAARQDPLTLERDCTYSH